MAAYGLNQNGQAINLSRQACSVAGRDLQRAG